MRALLIIIALISQLAWATLEFDSKLVEVDAAADAEKATVDFKFSNTGDKDVFISHINPDCDCLTIKASGGTTLPDKRIRYRPGETGVIRSIFKIGNNKGQVDQKVMVWLTGDPKDKPSIQLIALINVPQFISMVPRSLKWDIGSEPKPKRIDVTIQHDQDIKVTEVKSSSPNFEIKLVTIEEGKRYAIMVNPKNTDTPGITVVQVITDSTVKNQSRQQVFAMVQRPQE